jgi:hypothetical protein
VVTVPLVLLAIPAIASGWLIGTMLYGNWFGGAITIAEVRTRAWPPWRRVPRRGSA